jgi:hypothetical protein
VLFSALACLPQLFTHHPLSSCLQGTAAIALAALLGGLQAAVDSFEKCRAAGEEVIFAPLFKSVGCMMIPYCLSHQMLHISIEVGALLFDSHLSLHLLFGTEVKWLHGTIACEASHC